jgi:hypothetical protein
MTIISKLKSKILTDYLTLVNLLMSNNNLILISKYLPD